MIRNAVFALALTLFVSGCSDAKAKDRVKELLIDASTAEFSDVHTKGGVTCGFVNAKNRLGAFTGPRVFIVQDDIPEILDGIPSTAFLNDMASKCDDRIFNRYSRTTLNPLRVEAGREIRNENATN